MYLDISIVPLVQKVYSDSISIPILLLLLLLLLLLQRSTRNTDGTGQCNVLKLAIVVHLLVLGGRVMYVPMQAS